ncbi:MAG TPA: hypothetical protein VMF05_03305 [Stellaceae bacterium]|nr:hypothetical protein [Stellaceae bacterium]
MLRPKHRLSEIVTRLVVIGLMLAVGGCGNAIDVICPPAGQCPNTRSAHGGGY